jgi:hypothetical protein
MTTLPQITNCPGIDGLGCSSAINLALTQLCVKCRARLDRETEREPEGPRAQEPDPLEAA